MPNTEDNSYCKLERKTEEEKVSMSNTFIQVHEEWIQLKKTTNLRMDEIALLCKIHSLMKNDKGACTASNAYFADLFCTSERNIQNYLKKLKSLELITHHEVRVGMKTTTRLLRVQENAINKLIYSKKKNSDKWDEELCISERRNEEEQVKKDVKPHEESYTLIKEEKRKEKISRDSSADALLEPANLSYEEQMRIIEYFKVGRRYSSKCPEIQELTGYSGRLIFDTIEAYKQGKIYKPHEDDRMCATAELMQEHICTYVRLALTDDSCKADVESLLNMYRCDELSDDKIRTMYIDEYIRQSKEMEA